MSNQARHLRDYPLHFLGNDEWRQGIDGDFVRIVDATADVYLSFDGGPWVKRAKGQAQQGFYSQLAVKSLVAQSVLIVAGFGDMDDNRAAVTVNVATALDPGNSIINGADVVVGAGLTVQVCAGNAARKDIILRGASTNPANIFPRIGGLGVGAASGVELGSGEGLPPWETTAAIYCHNPGAVAIKIQYVENQKI